MAYEKPNEMLTLEAGADLSASQYRFVKVTGGQTCGAVAAATDHPIGVLQNKPDAAGRAAAIMVEGISKAKAGAAIAAGANLTIDAVGRVVTAVATNRIYAIALQAAGAADEGISVQLVRGTL